MSEQTTDPLEEFLRLWSRYQEAVPEMEAAYAQVTAIVVAPETPRPRPRPTRSPSRPRTSRRGTP